MHSFELWRGNINSTKSVHTYSTSTYSYVSGPRYIYYCRNKNKIEKAEIAENGYLEGEGEGVRENIRWYLRFVLQPFATICSYLLCIEMKVLVEFLSHIIHIHFIQVCKCFLTDHIFLLSHTLPLRILEAFSCSGKQFHCTFTVKIVKFYNLDHSFFPFGVSLILIASGCFCSLSRNFHISAKQNTV